MELLHRLLHLGWARVRPGSSPRPLSKVHGHESQPRYYPDHDQTRGQSYQSTDVHSGDRRANVGAEPGRFLNIDEPAGNEPHLTDGGKWMVEERLPTPAEMAEIASRYDFEPDADGT